MNPIVPTDLAQHLWWPANLSRWNVVRRSCMVLSAPNDSLVFFSLIYFWAHTYYSEGPLSCFRATLICGSTGGTIPLVLTGLLWDLEFKCLKSQLCISLMNSTDPHMLFMVVLRLLMGGRVGVFFWFHTEHSKQSYLMDDLSVLWYNICVFVLHWFDVGH